MCVIVVLVMVAIRKKQSQQIVAGIYSYMLIIHGFVMCTTRVPLCITCASYSAPFCLAFLLGKIQYKADDKEEIVGYFVYLIFNISPKIHRLSPSAASI